MVRNKTVKRIVKLVFPQDQIKQPLTYKMALKYEVIPNIRRARVTATVGELVLELKGEQGNIEKGLKYLQRNNVQVKPIEGDVID